MTSVASYYAQLQADALALVEQWREQGHIDLTTTGFVDLTQDHDPVTAEVLEDAHVW